MRYALALCILLALAGASLAEIPPLAPTPPAKVTSDRVAPPPDPALLRQGGDTVFDAFTIPALPFVGGGTTAGYTDDYDEVCPYTGSTSPDVVYAYTPAADVYLDIDLCGSSYDTKLFVYDAALNLIACNDDFYVDDICGVYVSKLEGVAMAGGETYYWIVDGYGGDFGDYVIEALLYEPCELDCPPGGTPEGEPPLQDGQINAFNDGCASANPDGFQDIHGDDYGELVLCGTSGWFTFGGPVRDTDWFVATFGPDGVIELTADAELPLYVFELGPQDCNTVEPVQTMDVGPCAPGSLTVTGEPASTVWLWTGPTVYMPPGGAPTPYEFDYILWLSGLAPGPVRVETATWSGVKSLYR